MVNAGGHYPSHTELPVLACNDGRNKVKYHQGSGLSTSVDQQLHRRMTMRAQQSDMSLGKPPTQGWDGKLAGKCRKAPSAASSLKTVRVAHGVGPAGGLVRSRLMEQFPLSASKGTGAVLAEMKDRNGPPKEPTEPILGDLEWFGARKCSNTRESVDRIRYSDFELDCATQSSRLRDSAARIGTLRAIDPIDTGIPRLSDGLPAAVWPDSEDNFPPWE